MNCKQANENISIREILESFSIFPTKENRRTAFYFAIDREELTPSLSVDYTKNIAFDFGTGKKYDNVSIVQAVKRCSVPEALEYLKQFDFSVPKQNSQSIQNETEEKSYKILGVTDVKHPALLEYLKSRKLESQKSDLNEIHYELSGKNYFGIGFRNDFGGYEIRNPFCKICLGKKDISTIKNGKDAIRIFEGFTDFLSFRLLEKSLEKNPSDYLILNSVSMVYKTFNLLKMYPTVELYLDNDSAGNKATELLNTEFPHAEDCRILYRDSKDLNEFLMQTEIPQNRQRKFGR